VAKSFSFPIELLQDDDDTAPQKPRSAKRLIFPIELVPGFQPQKKIPPIPTAPKLGGVPAIAAHFAKNPAEYAAIMARVGQKKLREQRQAQTVEFISGLRTKWQTDDPREIVSLEIIDQDLDKFDTYPESQKALYVEKTGREGRRALSASDKFARSFESGVIGLGKGVAGTFEAGFKFLNLDISLGLNPFVAIKKDLIRYRQENASKLARERPQKTLDWITSPQFILYSMVEQVPRLIPAVAATAVGGPLAGAKVGALTIGITEGDDIADSVKEAGGGKGAQLTGRIVGGSVVAYMEKFQLAGLFRGLSTSGVGLFRKQLLGGVTNKLKDAARTGAVVLGSGAVTLLENTLNEAIQAVPGPVLAAWLTEQDLSIEELWAAMKEEGVSGGFTSLGIAIGSTAVHKTKLSKVKADVRKKVRAAASKQGMV